MASNNRIKQQSFSKIMSKLVQLH